MFCARLLGAKRKVQSSSRPAMAVAAILVLAGLGLVGSGLYIHAKAVTAQFLLKRAFDESLRTRQPVKPWSWADTWPVARLDVPHLGASSIVLYGSSGQALAFGPSLLENVPQPGEPGTSVIAAHRDTHFSWLRDAKVGDEIQVTRTDGAIHWFRIAEMQVVHWNASGIDPNADGSWLVLSTCWPLDAAMQGDKRLVVRAQLTGRQISELPKPRPAPG